MLSTSISGDQVVQEYLVGKTLHGLGLRHDLSYTPIRIWVDKSAAGVFDEDVGAAITIQEHEARIAFLKRLIGKQAPELEFQKGLSGMDGGREARPCPSSPVCRPVHRRRMPTVGDRALHLLPRLARVSRRHRPGRGHARGQG